MFFYLSSNLSFSLSLSLSIHFNLMLPVYSILHTSVLTFIQEPKHTTPLNELTLTRWQSNNRTVCQTKGQSVKIWLSGKKNSVEQKLLIQNKYRTLWKENEFGREWLSYLNYLFLKENVLECQLNHTADIIYNMKYVHTHYVPLFKGKFK